ncbi:MAG: ABC transporter ATP-binding protein [Deltaproteobacteria bacterium]|nr:MAG: ABC transporter ATP-binding protein [Deltaproteobacteria bacterium]
MSIETHHISKTFGHPPTTVLRNVSLTIPDNDFVSITGRSGSGKSTLLYILSTLDNATEGKIVIDGETVSAMTPQEVHRFRNQKMGFVFQFHYLLPELTALENILIPARKTKVHEAKREKALALLEKFDLKGKDHRLPSQLSGGEQQRVAIARSLIMDPQYLFADEPTGNLDSVNGDTVIKILKDLNEHENMTIIIVTHDPDYAAMAKRRIHLVDGEVVDQ